MSVFPPARWLQERWVATGGRQVAYFTLAHGLYNLLAGGFEIALILRLTGSFERIVWFNLLFYVLLYFAFVAGTYLLRSGKASRSFRLDLLAQAAGCFYLVAAFGSLTQPWVLAGFFVFKGTSEGLFWSTRHSALIHSIPDGARDRWSLGLQTLTILLGVILPVLSGFVISELALPAPAGSPLPAGYLPVYALTGVLALAAAVLAPSLRIPVQTVRLAALGRLRRTKGKAVWLTYLACGTVVSITVNLSVGILNFHVLGSEFRLGLFASWIAAASAVFFFGVRRMVSRWNLSRIQMVLWGSTGELSSRLLFAAWPTVAGLAVKSLVDSFIVPLRSLFGENVVRRRVELLTAREGVSVAEGILFQETVLVLARTAGCLTLLVLLEGVRVDPVTMARALLWALLAYSAVDFALIRLLDRGNRLPTFSSDALAPGSTKL